ncbi:SHOCT domain-containing protein [Microbispora sp. NPDC049125]|uniref:SHOCT domain-containing protein n=1 Tax=Microbispora sp. NPDC049125 TaxID=3154929 RepID=UPI003466363E
MRYRIRVGIGVLISLVCLGFALYALYQLVRGGSCASGGNYVSARACPPGTEKWAWVLPGAIIGGLLSFFLGTFKGFGPAPVAGASPAPSFTPRSAGSGQDPLDRLRKLQTLLDAGTVSRAEFETAKARILSEM